MTTALMPSDRKFGWTFAALFFVVGALSHPWMMAVGAAFAVVTLTRAHWLAPPKHAWVKVGAPPHRVGSPLVMGGIFLGGFPPGARVLRPGKAAAPGRPPHPAAASPWKSRGAP